MEKEEKKAVATAVVSPEDNILDTIDKRNKVNLEISDSVKSELEKERDEKVKEKIKERMRKAQYQKELALLELRRDRELAKLKKERLHGKDALYTMLFGGIAEGIEEKDGGKYKKGDRIEPTLDYNLYDEKLRELDNKNAEKVREVNRTFSKYHDRLQEQHGVYWCFDWDY